MAPPDDRISGVVDVDSWDVPFGETVYVEDDLVLRARSSITIEGMLIGMDRPDGPESSEAPRIELESALEIHVTGAVAGGKGVCFTEGDARTSMNLEGGAGSTIVLRAPTIWIDGVVVGGTGGGGGAGGKGGDGGDVIFEGAFLTHAVDSDPEAIGGAAGPAGAGVFASQKGGKGGNGGSVVVRPYPHAPKFMDGSEPVALLSGFDKTDSLLVTEARSWACPTGDDGAHGGDAQGANGADGAYGGNGSPASPNGGDGGGAGKGGDAAAGSGSDGEVGGTCCDPPKKGGRGGTGGAGGSAVAGYGGNGGDGGGAYWDPSIPPGYRGGGGNGGNGKDGGDATSGGGGWGGEGGDGIPPGDGGRRGAAGSAPSAGAAGAPGFGGAGAPPGTNGGAGGGGSATARSPGEQGWPGDLCDIVH